MVLFLFAQVAGWVSLQLWRNKKRMYLVLILIIKLTLVSGVSYGEFQNPKVKKLYSKVQKKHPEVKEISVTDFKKSRADFILVDVRASKERRVSVISGAISKKEFEEGLSQKKYKNNKIVVYCTIGERSARYIKELKLKGVEALNLEGSVLGWIDSGAKLVDLEGAPTHKVHVFGSKWNAVPKGYEAVWNFF